MDCAKHIGTPAVAYCRNCGKALCESCKCDVQGAVFCESCRVAAGDYGVHAPGPQDASHVTPPVSPKLSSDEHSPLGAILLIALGVLFLLANLRWVSFQWISRFWPVSLIVIGLWLFIRRRARRDDARLKMRYYRPNPACSCSRCSTRGLMGSAVLVSLGLLFLLANISDYPFERTWPVLLMVVGTVKVIRYFTTDKVHINAAPHSSTQDVTPPPTPIAAPPSDGTRDDEVHNG